MGDDPPCISFAHRKMRFLAKADRWTAAPAPAATGDMGTADDVELSRLKMGSRFDNFFELSDLHNDIFVIILFLAQTNNTQEQIGLVSI